MITKQLNLIEEVCPRCMKPESEVDGELHPDDGLCLKCEGEFIAGYDERFDAEIAHVLRHYL